MGDQASVVQQQIYRGMDSAIEFDDDSGIEGEHIAQQHAAGSEAEFNVQADIHESV